MSPSWSTSPHLKHKEYFTPLIFTVTPLNLRYWLRVLILTMSVSIYLDLRWWPTMQCAASSFSKGTSNKAWWNNSSFAVGRLLGSTSRHFWINSWKNKNKGERKKKLKLLISLPNRHSSFNCLPLPLSPVAMCPRGTEWHCLWLLGTHKTNLHYSGFPTQPSEEVIRQRMVKFAKNVWVIVFKNEIKKINK